MFYSAFDFLLIKSPKVFTGLLDNISRGKQGALKLPAEVRGFTLEKKHIALNAGHITRRK